MPGASILNSKWREPACEEAVVAAIPPIVIIIEKIMVLTVLENIGRFLSGAGFRWKAMKGTLKHT